MSYIFSVAPFQVDKIIDMYNKVGNTNVKMKKWLEEIGHVRSHVGVGKKANVTPKGEMLELFKDLCTDAAKMPIFSLLVVASHLLINNPSLVPESLFPAGRSYKQPHQAKAPNKVVCWLMFHMSMSCNTHTRTLCWQRSCHRCCIAMKRRKCCNTRMKV